MGVEHMAGVSHYTVACGLDVPLGGVVVPCTDDDELFGDDQILVGVVGHV